MAKNQLLPVNNTDNQAALASMAGSLSGADNTTPSRLSPALVAQEQKIQNTEAPEGVSPQSIIQKYIDACGGEDKLKGIKTLYLKTQAKSNMQGTESTTEMVIKNNIDNNSFTQMFVDGKLTMTTVVNDKEGYYIDSDGKKNKFDSSTYKMVKKLMQLLIQIKTQALK